MKRAIYLIFQLFLFFCLFLNTAVAEDDKVRIGYLQSDIHQLACWVAMEKGFYLKNGVNAQVAGIFRAGPEEMSAFAAGALDMGYVGEAPATTAVANGVAKATVLAQVNTEGSAIMVKKGSAIQKPADLAGKTVAIPGHSTVQDFLLQKALEPVQGGSQKSEYHRPETPRDDRSAYEPVRSMPLSPGSRIPQKHGPWAWARSCSHPVKSGKITPVVSWCRMIVSGNSSHEMLKGWLKPMWKQPDLSMRIPTKPLKSA